MVNTSFRLNLQMYLKMNKIYLDIFEVQQLVQNNYKFNLAFLTDSS